MDKNEQAQYDEILKQNQSLQQELMPFREKYFKGLSTNTIAELAKKSICMTADYMRMVHIFEDVIEKLNKLKNNELNNSGNNGECNGMTCRKKKEDTSLSCWGCRAEEIADYIKANIPEVKYSTEKIKNEKI